MVEIQRRDQPAAFARQSFDGSGRGDAQVMAEAFRTRIENPGLVRFRRVAARTRIKEIVIREFQSQLATAWLQVFDAEGIRR